MFGNSIRLFQRTTLFFCVLAAPAWAQDGRLAAARSSMESLETALTLCEVDTGYMVSLEALNDLPYAVSPPNPSYDYINNGGGCYVIRSATGRFEPGRVDLVNRYLAWQGPYITYQDGQTQLGTTPYDQGSPLDPWGNPYYLFTPMGLVRGDSGTITQELYGDAFDRYAIVSLGPDGVMSGDDLGRLFGGGVTVFSISSVRGFYATWNNGIFSAPSGASLTIHGYNMGTDRNGGQVFFGSTELTDVRSWSATAIEVVLPRELDGQADLTVRRGSASTNALALTVVYKPNAAEGWALYP